MGWQHRNEKSQFLGLHQHWWQCFWGSSPIYCSWPGKNLLIWEGSASFCNCCFLGYELRTKQFLQATGL